MHVQKLANYSRLYVHTGPCGKKINAFQKENAQRRQRNSDGWGRGGEGLSSMTITDSDTITHGHVLLYSVVVPDTYRFTRELTV